MDARTRRELTHYGAPAAFLLVVTIAVLLIKAGLSGHDTATTQQRTRSTPTTTTAATTTTTTTNAARFYTIQPGDTLGAIAIREHTTVTVLMQLNPGIDPQALHSGQRIRVG
jgi:LysM repeat protein